MFVLSNLLVAIANVLDVLITILWWMIIIRALLSWVNPDPYNPIVVMLNRVTEPILQPFRRIVSPYQVGFDLSPIFAILALMFIRYFVVKSLFDIAVRLQ